MLDSGELILLRQQVASQFKRQRIISISASVAFAGLYIATYLFPMQITFSLMSGAASLMVVFVLWLLFDPGSWLRRYKALQLDLAYGVVHSFLGIDHSVQVEVLPRSEVVYKSNSARLKKWGLVTISAIAKTPPISSIASDWLLPVDGANGRFFSGKRGLCSAERDEIRRWAAQVFDHRRRHAVSYVCWAAMLGWLSRWGNPDLYYGALAVTGYTGSKMYSEVRLFLALSHDADEGVVVINCRAKVEQGNMKPVGHPSEFLPTAKLKWTDDGAAADWRKQP